MEGTDNHIAVAILYARILARLPFGRAFFLVGSRTVEPFSAQSDIDFCLVAQPGRIWLHRFLVQCTILILGIRRTSTKRIGRICLNTSLSYEVANKKSSYFNLETSVLLATTSQTSRLEIFLEKTGLAILGELSARFIQVIYIYFRFRKYRAQSDAILHLNARHAIYYPPRISKKGSVLSLDSPYSCGHTPLGIFSTSSFRRG